MVARKRRSGRALASSAVPSGRRNVGVIAQSDAAAFLPVIEIVGPAAFAAGIKGGAPSKDAVRDAARVLRAQRELNQLAERRLIYQAGRAKTSQSAIAALLGTSQPTVSRIVRQIEQDPSLLAPSPNELIYRRAVGQIDTATMMKGLVSYEYRSGQYDPSGGDAYLRGDWRQIENGLAGGLITDEEYEEIAREAPSAKSASADH